MNRKRVRGFTIVELLVVITIIGMLMAMLMPAVSKVRSQVQRVECINNQSQIAKSVLSAAAGNDRMPRTLEFWPGAVKNPTNQQWHGWVVTLMRELNHGDVYDKVLDANISNSNSRNVQYFLEDLICPSNLPANFDGAPLSYVANGGQWDNYGGSDPKSPADWKGNGAWSNNVCLASQPPVEISLSYIVKHDGTANTLLLSENVNAQNWNQPILNEEHLTTLWYFKFQLPAGFTVQLEDPLTVERARPSSYHDGTFVVAFCDGRALPVSSNIEYHVYARLMTSNGRATGKPNRPESVGDASYNYQWAPVEKDELIP